MSAVLLPPGCREPCPPEADDPWYCTGTPPRAPCRAHRPPRQLVDKALLKGVVLQLTLQPLVAYVTGRKAGAQLRSSPTVRHGTALDRPAWRTRPACSRTLAACPTRPRPAPPGPAAHHPRRARSVPAPPCHGHRYYGFDVFFSSATPRSAEPPTAPLLHGAGTPSPSPSCFLATLLLGPYLIFEPAPVLAGLLLTRGVAHTHLPGPALLHRGLPTG